MSKTIKGDELNFIKNNYFLLHVSDLVFSDRLIVVKMPDIFFINISTLYVGFEL